MHPPIRVGVIGAGTSATLFHAPFITTNRSFKLVKFLRTSTKPVDGYQDVTVVSDIDLFLSAPPEIDLAVITTPTHTHFDLAKACLQSGKHVVLEKPMAATHQECLQLCELSRATNRLLAVYHNRRWDGDFLTVQKLLAVGALGRIVEYESHFDRFRNAVKPGWKEQDLPGSGILYDLGAHLIDQALTLFGPPASLTATVLNQRQLPDSTVPDAFTVMLHYEPPSPYAHLTAVLKASMLSKIAGPRFLLHGNKGSFVKYELDCQEAQLRGGMSPEEPEFGFESPSCYGTLDSVALPEPDWARGGRATAPAGQHTAATATAASAGEAEPRATATVDWVEVGMQEHAEAKSSTSGKGAVVNVITKRGCWTEFYDNVARILVEQQQQQHDGTSTAAGNGDLNNQLAVKPEQAADVVRLIEVAMQSSKEGRTIRLV